MKQAVSEHYYFDNGQLFDKRNTAQTLLMTDVKTKIKLYEDRVNGWFLKVAERLKNNNEAGFVILSIAVAYIEGNQQFREGKSSEGKSKQFFVKAVRRIFDKENIPQTVIEDYYSQVRCGLFHDGMTRSNVVISGDFTEPLKYTNDVIKINPHLFLDKIKADFETYILALEQNQALQNKFVKRFDMDTSQ